MVKIIKRIILDGFFEEIKFNGYGVPRDASGGVVSGVVGRKYLFVNGVTDETMLVRCSQSHPYAYKVVED